MHNAFIGWSNADAWDVVSDGTVAMIANPELVLPRDVDEAKHDWPQICGDCDLARSSTCQRCFWLPMLLVHDTFVHLEERNAQPDA